MLSGRLNNRQKPYRLSGYFRVGHVRENDHKNFSVTVWRDNSNGHVNAVLLNCYFYKHMCRICFLCSNTRRL